MSDPRRAAVVDAPVGDLLALAAALVAVPSESHHETDLADAVEARLRLRCPHLAVERVEDNVVARTNLGRARRVLLGGHLDTVPANGNALPRIDDDTLYGLGAADMKGSVAALLAVAEQVTDPRVDVTYCFYESEEVEERHNGLRRLFADRPDLVASDLAILAEPTEGWVEAGCQGTLHVRATYRGARAHTARPWTGHNALHDAAAAAARIAANPPAAVVVDGLEFTQALQVVRIEGGVANNVVPDTASVVVNRRFAPTVSVDEAYAEVVELLGEPAEVEIVNASPGAGPNLLNPLVAEFVGVLDLAVRPKLGWTDVARFAAAGIPALNFGAGDPLVAHTAGEYVTRDAVEGCARVLAWFVGNDADRARLVREAAR